VPTYHAVFVDEGLPASPYYQTAGTTREVFHPNGFDGNLEGPDQSSNQILNNGTNYMPAVFSIFNRAGSGKVVRLRSISSINLGEGPVWATPDDATVDVVLEVPAGSFSGHDSRFTMGILSETVGGLPVPVNSLDTSSAALPSSIRVTCNGPVPAGTVTPVRAQTGYLPHFSILASDGFQAYRTGRGSRNIFSNRFLDRRNAAVQPITLNAGESFVIMGTWRAARGTLTHLPLTGTIRVDGVSYFFRTRAVQSSGVMLAVVNDSGSGKVVTLESLGTATHEHWFSQNNSALGPTNSDRFDSWPMTEWVRTVDALENGDTASVTPMDNAFPLNSNVIVQRGGMVSPWFKDKNLRFPLRLVSEWAECGMRMGMVEPGNATANPWFARKYGRRQFIKGQSDTMVSLWPGEGVSLMNHHTLAAFIREVDVTFTVEDEPEGEVGGGVTPVARAFA
jgi:hypothetical protein